MALEQLKRELERFGEQNDGAQHSRGSKMLNITRDTGELLAVLVQTRGAQAVLEIGTSNGYSTLWLAEGKRTMAATNFERAGLTPWIEQLVGEAGSLLPCLPTAGYQLIFLDSERRHYQAWWPEIQRLLAPRGLLVVDNAISHEDEMREWMAQVRRDPDFLTSLVPVGKGEWLVVRL